MLMARGNVALNICNVLSTGEEVAGGSAAVLMDVIVGQGAGGGEKIVEKDSKYERDLAIIVIFVAALRFNDCFR